MNKLIGKKKELIDNYNKIIKIIENDNLELITESIRSYLIELSNEYKYFPKPSIETAYSMIDEPEKFSWWGKTDLCLPRSIFWFTKYKENFDELINTDINDVFFTYILCINIFLHILNSKKKNKYFIKTIKNNFETNMIYLDMDKFGNLYEHELEKYYVSYKRTPLEKIKYTSYIGLTDCHAQYDYKSGKPLGNTIIQVVSKGNTREEAKRFALEFINKNTEYTEEQKEKYRNGLEIYPVDY